MIRHCSNVFYLRSIYRPALKSLGLLAHPRNYSASPTEFETVVASNTPAVFVSRTRDPHANAALKKRIFGLSSSQPATTKGAPARLFLYVNDPAVLLGRYGNAWHDAVLPLARTLELPLLRRRSGGSTVAVDAGTVCFASTAPVLPVVVETVNALPARVTKRLRPRAVTADEEEEDPLAAVFGAPPASDPIFGGGSVAVPADGISVLVDGPAIKLAYDASENLFVVRAQDDPASVVALECVASPPRVYEGIVHVDSKLDALNALVRETQRKPFRNIGLDVEVFIDAIADDFQSKHGAAEMSNSSNEEPEDYNILTAGLFDEIMEKSNEGGAELVIIDETSLDSKSALSPEEWEWLYGRTPAFTHTISFYHGIEDVDLSFRVVRGHIMAVNCSSTAVDISRIPTNGSVRYCYDELAQYIDDAVMLECLKDNV
ncbi:hypothetical protein D0Z00_004058 [Geotrichum galactomycetum]|uniref:Uncharacterized protein n=1 Tax=Geotrichum galactomycetum TaxID=27317 RepID=A0ACB6UZJ5_9ASCO|nr:hypothetical protein D0Z00_004058 [Geotrichum candidum]